MTKYRVHSEWDCEEFDSLEEAERFYQFLKDEQMVDGVVANESFVQMDKSEDEDFEEHEIIKKVIAIRDTERTELRTPKEEGFDWDYWAKWQEVKI